MCHANGSKCIKCNSPYKVKHHRDIVWCCKTNFKTNLPRLKTKKEEPCLHSFKCINCKGEHQADRNMYLFWRHKFNKKWYAKKYQELCENRSKSILSSECYGMLWTLTFFFFFYLFFLILYFFSFKFLFFSF